MPTSSTAKIAAGKSSNPNGQQAQGRYARHRRPKSCKYDTYRLRSRTSVVEENLFGEPLKNKLMARSRSMEAISCPEQEEQPTLFTRRGPPPRYQHLCPREDLKRPERPRTALATMRPSGGNVHPEFERRSSGQGGEPGVVRVVSGDQVRSLIVPSNGSKAQPLVLSHRDFDKIRMAARVMTTDERDAVRRDQEEAKEAALRAAAERKAEFETAASFHHSPDETELDRENKLRDHHLIERARDLKMEQLPEIKKLNQHIIQVKCHAIRDVQLEEKEKRLNEMAEADRHLEEQMEMERKQAEEMAATRAARTVDFNKEYRLGLDIQKAEIEAQRLLDLEKYEAEMVLRRTIEAAQREQDIKEADAKKTKTIEMQQQMMADVDEAKRRKELEEEMIQLNEERIEALQNARRVAEIGLEKEGKKAKREREMNMMKMKAAVEKEQELKLKREELRLIRQQEVEDRKWRQREIEVARMKAKREEEVRKIRVEQIRQREEIAARSVERDRQHWDEVRNMWQEGVDLEMKQQDMRSKGRKEYLNTLQSQMARNAQERLAGTQALKLEANYQDTERDHQQKRILQIREKKLQQLKAYNVPDKYIKEIDRKCHQAHKARFTHSYFGLK